MSWLLQELTFLVIDDSRFTRRVVRNALAGYGVKSVIEAEDAVQGLALLKDEQLHVDMVLVDQEMPILNGTEFAKMVRKDTTLPDSAVPIIMITAHAERSMVVEASQSGVDGFLAKPFSPEELYDHIMGALEGARGAPEKDTGRAQLEKPEFEKLAYLVIDDSSFARRVIRDALRSFGVRVVLEVSDAVAGLALLRDEAVTVDIILVDREMPTFDGIEFTRVVRRDEGLGEVETPIIMISGLADKKHIVEAKNAGVTSFVAKPFSPGELKEHILFALADPRTFIKARGYVGPDRRWGRGKVKERAKAAAEKAGKTGRRTSDEKWEL